MIGNSKVIPLKNRPWDRLFIAFFTLNFLFICPIVDMEQLTVSDPTLMEENGYPAWPPAPLIDLVHWYGFTFDPALIARPPWWQATIWIDMFFFWPFYGFAIYAFWKGRNWIRLGAIVWASVMLTNVTIIMYEEVFGPYASPHLWNVVAANLAWIVMPILTLWRMGKSVYPFSGEGGVPPA